MRKSSKFALAFLACGLAAATFSSWAAQRADIDMTAPGVRALQQKMDGRFDDLRPHFGSGALGFTRDGLVEVRDLSKVKLSERVSVSALVSEDNRDRRAVYREIAVANGHPEWEGQVRQIFADQWIASAKPNWWYQDSSGAWRQK